MTDLVIDFSSAPTVSDFLEGEAVVTGLMGPFGSGKSVGCSAWVMNMANSQEPAPDGIRYTRIAIVRNTAPELKSTTIKTFTDNFPEGPHGRVIFSSPINYHIKFPARPGVPGIDCEVIFVPLDKPRDVRKLLSLELTGAWLNEAREIPEPIIDALTGRIGRYPSNKKGRCTRAAIIADTNPPDDVSWWFKKFEGGGPRIKFKKPDGTVADLTWRIHKQPPAVLELKDTGRGTFECIEEGYTDLVYASDEVLPAAGRFWGINPEAENLTNLPPTYYANLVLNKSLDFIRVYAQGKYGFVQEGKAVVPEFQGEIMISEFPIMKDRPLIIGIDIGGGTLQPAAVITQRHPQGTWLVHSELVATDMGVDRFADMLHQHISEMYPDNAVAAVYTDPAAEKRDEIFENKVNEFLRSKGFPVKPAPTNDPGIRRLAIAQPCNRLIMGKPGLMVHPRARMVCDGLKGKWYFKRLNVVGLEAYSETPIKNEYSHPCEALGYALLGGGERHVAKAHQTPQQANQWSNGWNAGATDWSVF